MTASTAPQQAPQEAGALHLINRLHEAFAVRPAPKANTIDNDAAVALLRRFLSLTGWRQGSRRIFEALPHLQAVGTTQSLRNILFRLGYKTTVGRAAPANIRNEFLPCFLCEADGRLTLIEEATSQGSARIFDATTKTVDERAIDSIVGQLIFPEKPEVESEQSAARSQPWSAAVALALRPVMARIFCLSLLTNLLALCPPLFVMVVYDKAIGARSSDFLIGLTACAALVVGADFMLRQFRGELQAYLGARLDNQINALAFRHLLFVPISLTENSPVGSQLIRLKQMASIRDAFTGMLANTIFDLPFVFLFLGVIGLIGGGLVAVPVALMACYAALAAWAIPNSRRLVRKAGEMKSKLQNIMIEAVSNQNAIYDLNVEEVWLERRRRCSAEAETAKLHSRQYTVFMETISQSFVLIAGAATLAVGAGQVVNGDLSGGALIAVMALSWRVLNPIRNFFLSALTFGQTLQSVEQIDRLLQIKLERKPNAAPSVRRRPKGDIRFENVSFRYPLQRNASLRGVTFDIKPGEMVAICGASGAGKSTALYMLMGFYQQQAGAIFADGVDIRQLDMGEWRQSLGVSLENADFFFGTVAQNIRLADPAATPAQLDAVTARLGLHDYFGGALDRGLDTKITNGALSRWPDALKRRLSLCRTFVRPAPILILDNPTDNLDTDGERRLLELLEERRGKSTILFTSHRPSMIKRADRMFWFDNGALRTSGRPNDVLPAMLAA